jgi:predicted PurR-regulated permease PerM
MTQILRYVLIISGIALLLFLLWFLRNILAYIIISWVLSLIGDPFVNFVSKRKLWKITIPRPLVAAFTVLAAWVVIVFVFILLIPVLLHQAQELSNLDVKNIISNLQEPINRIETIMAKYHLINHTSTNSVDVFLTRKIVSFIDLSDLSSILSLLTQFFGNIFVAVFSISFITFFFLKEEDLFSRMLFVFIPPQYEEKTMNAISSTKKLLSRYFIGISLDVFLIMTLVTIGLRIVGISFQNALIMGIFAGFINVIPYVGPLLGITFGLFMHIATNLEADFFTQLAPTLGFMLIVYFVVQIIDASVLQPFIYSNSVHAHPLEIFLVIMIAGNLAGVGAMIIAIPTYTVMRVILREFFSRFRVVQKMTDRI